MSLGLASSSSSSSSSCCSASSSRAGSLLLFLFLLLLLCFLFQRGFSAPLPLLAAAALSALLLPALLPLPEWVLCSSSSQLPLGSAAASFPSHVLRSGAVSSSSSCFSASAFSSSFSFSFSSCWCSVSSSRAGSLLLFLFFFLLLPFLFQSWFSAPLPEQILCSSSSSSLSSSLQPLAPESLPLPSPPSTLHSHGNPGL